jgi:hypothetical protein
VKKLRNQDSRFLKLSMKAMTGEAALPQIRRDEGEPFPVGAGKRKSKLDAAGARGEARRRYLSTTTLQSKRGTQAEQRGDNHPREAVRLIACPCQAARGLVGHQCGQFRVTSGPTAPMIHTMDVSTVWREQNTEQN